MKLIVTGLSALLVLTVVACSDDDEDSTPTGVEAVDQAIAAIVAGDAAAVASQAVLSSVECGTVEGLGGPPPCEAGEVEGTAVAVMPAAACEGYYLREAEIGRSFEAFLSLESTVEGVYRSSGIGDFFSADYVILLSSTDPQLGEVAREVFVSDEGVTGFFQGCGQSVQDLIEGHGLVERLSMAN